VKLTVGSGQGKGMTISKIGTQSFVAFVWKILMTRRGTKLEKQVLGENNNTSSQSGSPMTRVDSYDIPVQGNDGIH
jgi:hypothetical protein